VDKEYKKGIVIINEQQKLLLEQERILEEKFEEYELLKVPKESWSLQEMKRISEEIHEELSTIEVELDSNFMYPIVESAVVFVSPIPFMIKALQLLAMEEDGEEYDVLIFHNDRREKKELPGGKIIYTVAETGWQLV
jgi:hypothetical protein